MEILVHFRKVSDTRSHFNQEYPVLEMSLLLINALISGNKSWADVHIFGETRLVLIGTAMDPFHWRRNGPTLFAP